MTVPAKVYRRLVEGSREIRLLTLLPGSFHETFVCELKETTLDSEEDYESLSYVWGGSFDDREDGTINGIAAEVGHNLAQALRHLRYEEVERTLWVDALCINQQDVAERTAQVRLMGEIYRNARRTVVWLGSFAKSGGMAMNLIHQIATEGTEAAFEKDTEQARASLRLVLQCSWWQRAWIIQELALSRGEPLLYCGHSALPWSDFVTFWDSTTSTKLKQIPGSPHDLTKWQQFAAHVAPLRLIREWLPERRSWARLLLLTSHYLSTDPRDRIFALHGLLNPLTQSSWLPDYSLGTAEVFTSFTRYMIENHGLDFICYDKPRTRDDLPSWVPDYSSTSSLADAGGFDFLPEEIKNRADAGKKQDVHFSDDGKSLFFTGIPVDSVKSVVPSGVEIGMKRVFEQSLALYQNEGRESIPLPEILACRKPGYDPQYTEQVNELLQSEVPLSFDPVNFANLGVREQRLLPLLDFMFHAVKRHNFFVTERGFCGMAHPDVKAQEYPDIRPGDHVVVAYGSATPLLLRGPEGFFFTPDAYDLRRPDEAAETLKLHRSTLNGRTFKFVGSCGIPAIANGEAVTGSLRKFMCGFEVT